MNPGIALRLCTQKRLARLALWLAFAVAPWAFAQSDSDFLAAKDAYEHGDRRRLDLVAPKLANHVLAPYVEYWQLRLGIDTADADAVRAFLTRYPNTPLADRLRVDWLKALGKRGDWARFAFDYPPATGEDVELTCFGIQFRRSRDGGESALIAAKALWFSGATTPEACDPLFAALVANGQLTVDDRRARARLAVEAGNLRLAEAISADLPPDARITLREFAAVERDPLRALTKGEFAWKTRGGQDLALYALERAARKDAAQARAAWIKWRDRLPAADRQYGNGRVAYYAARQLLPEADTWYREAAPAQLTPEQKAWRVRAALRAQSWPAVLAAIDDLSDADRQESAWRYWRARALASTGATAEAQAVYETMATDASFYGLLAAEALGRGATQLETLTANPAQPNADLLAAFGRRPEVQRVVKLAELDLRPESLREWIYIVRGLDDDALLLAAEYARRVELYDRAINTAERTATRHNYGLRYLAPFREQFAAAARDQGVDEELLYGIARQESRFVPDIVSSAGAVGVMQLMPHTARWVAKQLAQSDYTPAMIINVDTNARFGAFYFKYWQDRLERLPALAAAAYNAGPVRAQQWRPAAPVEGAIWVETIPFNETRDYVKKVLANTMLYAHAFGHPYVPLSDRLGVVPPRTTCCAMAAQSP